VDDLTGDCWMPSRLDPRRGVGDLSPAADEREWRLVVGERGHRLVPSGRSAGWDVAGCLDPHRAGRGGSCACLLGWLGRIHL
jgi:hypothetical protein